MKQLHPLRRQAGFVTAVAVALTAWGCRGQQTAMTNPFLAPDRVPPPGTRMIAPGTAEPYYQGDPLPAMQSTAAPSASEPAPMVEPAAADLMASSGDGAVRIPGDDDQLRFPLPAAPGEAGPSSSAIAERTVASTSSVPQTAVQEPAAYTAVPAAYRATPAEAPPLAEHGPWRAPEVPTASTISSPASQLPQHRGGWPVATPLLAASENQAGPYSQPTYAPPQAPVAPTATMPVTLRPVASPPLEVASTAAPRIRFAGPAGTTPTGRAPMPASTAAPYMATNADSDVVQTVAVTELPPGASHYQAAPTANVAAQSRNAAASSPDGFRPRGSTR